MFTALVEWLQGEAAFFSSQHNNLQEMPLVLRECGLSTEADALYASLDMDVWKNHQTYLRSLLDHASTLTTPDQKMQFVMELAWLAGRQDGFYMMVEKEKAEATAVEVEHASTSAREPTAPAAASTTANSATVDGIMISNGTTTHQTCSTSKKCFRANTEKKTPRPSKP